MPRRIIYVPGKNLKPEPTTHRLHLWRSLVAGVQHAQPGLAEQMQRRADCFQLAAWNYSFYGEHASLESDIPWINRLMDKTSAGEEDIRDARSWHRIATQFMYAIGDRFHGLLDWIPDKRVKDMIDDTTPYFENQGNIADHIRGLLAQMICEAAQQGDRVLLIGHSMGAIVAYDTLWQLSHNAKSPCGVDLFLTLGSPLGMRYVQKQLLGAGETRTFPTGVSHWENVSATGDLVSLDKTVHDDFGKMVEDGLIDSIHDHCGGVYNWFRNDDGLNVHRSYGYLVNPVVGKIIADWWQGKVRSAGPILVAHRGYPSRYPENTRIGFEKALAAGVGFVELDVQLSKDRVPVVYHDVDTHRVSGVEGSLFLLTLSEIMQLDASFSERFGNTYPDNPVMTLDEFCALMQHWPDVKAFVEIKSGSIDQFGVVDTVDPVIEVIKPIAGRCVVISFHEGCIEYARTQHGMPIGWVLPKWNRMTEAHARRLNPDFIFVNKRLLPTGKCPLWSGPWQWVVYVVDDARQANGFAERGISYVETDRVGELLADLNLNNPTSG